MEAQFKTNKLSTNNTTSISAPPGAETNQSNGEQNSDVKTDTLAGFSAKRIIRGFARKDTLSMGDFFIGSMIVPGAGQMFNHDWWKLPIVYGGMGAGIYLGIDYHKQYKETLDTKFKTYSTISFIGAGLFYWASLMDGAIRYKTSYRAPVPAKAAIYSALLPGLGQAYNGDYWKIPIWVGGFAACGYFYHLNDMEYRRFKYIYMMGNDPSSGYYGGITASQAEWYKDTYRRYRDYSLIAIIAVYALNVIDANVFAYMADFDVDDNLASLSVEPAIIEPINPLLASNCTLSPALGVRMNLNF